MNSDEVKQLVKSAMASSSTRMTIWDLVKMFRELTGTDIPYRQFGFLDLETYLRSLSDILVVLGTGNNASVLAILTKDSAHIANMIIHQKKPTNSHVPKQRNMHIFSPTSNPNKSFNIDSKTNLKQGNKYPNSINKSFTTKPPLLPLPPFINGASSSKQTFPPKQMKETVPFKQNIGKYSASTSTNIVSKPRQSTMKTSTPKNTRWSAPDVNNKRQLQNGGLHISVKEDKSVECAMNFDHNMNYKVPFIVQENLKSLIAKNAEGIWLIKLCDIYKQTYNAELDYWAYGYRSLAEMCCALHYIFKYQDYGTCGAKLYSANFNIPQEDIDLMNAVKDTSSKIASPETKPAKQPIPFSVFMTQKIYPQFVLCPGESIPLVKVPQEEDYEAIRIGEIYDLSKFWFTLERHETDIQDMNKELDKFYGNGDKLQIPANLVQPGLFCVLNRGGEYSRAIVVKIIDFNIKVFCVDFGTVTTTTINNLHFMHKEFAELPRQGLRGSLSRIRPPIKNDQWSRDSAYRFVQLVQDRILFAGINAVKTSKDDPIYEIVLCDAAYEEDIFIQDVLVAEGFAVMDTQEQHDGGLSHFYGHIPNVDELHMYPTFRELEQAMVPNAIEMRSLVALKIPLHQIYPKYFEHKSKLTKDQSANSIKERRITLKEQNLAQDKSHEPETLNNTSSFSARRSLSQSAACLNSPVRTNMSALASSLSKQELFENGIEPVNYENVDEVRNLFKRVLISPPPCPQMLSSKENVFERSGLLPSKPAILNPRVLPMHTPRMPTGTIHPQIRFPSPHQVKNHRNIQHNGFISKLESKILNGDKIDPNYSFIVRNLNVNNLKLEQFSGSGESDKSVTQKRDKKYVVTLTIHGKVIHVVRYMYHGCFIPEEVMNLFNCKQSLNCIRRFLNLSGISLLTIHSEDIDKSLYDELLEKQLIKDNQTSIESASLSDLEEFISIIINDDYEIPHLQDIVAMHKGSSAVWYC